jgi:2-dehydropantoate 2-reductase
MHQPSVLVVGAGAIGALYGSALARAGARVSVVCRSDAETVRRDGFVIRSPLLGDHTFRPQEVLTRVASATVYDYVVLTVKVLNGVDRAALIAPAVTPATTIVLIQNGVDIEREIADAFVANELVSVLAFVGVGRTGAGQIHHQSLGSLVMGTYPDGIGPATRRLAELFESGGVSCKLTDRVIGARWQKALWNATFNPVSILGAVLDTGMMLRTPDDQAFIRTAMLEVARVAAAAGYEQSPQFIEQLIAGTRAMPPYKTSMALDFEAKRPLELEAILGNVLRIGRQHGAATPVLDTLYALAKMVAAKNQRATD